MKANNPKQISPDPDVRLILNSIDRLTLLAQSKMESVPGSTDQNSSYTASPEQLRLQWTFPKIGLVELIYSLKELRVFNNGDADLKTITACFEYMFNVDLGNITSSFQGILQRKKGVTNITDKLRDIFLKKVDSSLEG
jgi:hypothetical protein